MTRPATATGPDPFAPPPPDAVRPLALRGVRWVVALLAVRQVVGIASNAAIARLVSPRDYGLMAMVAWFTSLAALVSDLGLTWGAVQARELDRRRLNALSWIGGLAGLAAWGACAAAGPPLGRFYRAPEVAPLAAALGAGLLLGNLAAAPLAVLRREVRPRALALIQTLAMLAGAAAGLAGAAAGLGPWALVAQALVPPLVLGLAAGVASGFRPGLDVDLRGALPLLGFGGWLTAANLLNYVQLYGDGLVVAHRFGAEAAGLYNRAFYLRTLPALYATVAFNDVMIPALSALRGDPTRLASGYREALAAIAFVACPLGTLLGVAAPEVVRVLYGPRWDEAVPILRWLAVAAVALPLQATGVWLYIAAGRSRGYFAQALALTPPLVAAQWLGARGGPTGVAAATALAFAAVVTPVTLALAHRAAGLPLRPTLRAVAPALAAVVLAATAALALGRSDVVSGWDAPARLAGNAAVGAVVYLAAFTALGGVVPGRLAVRLSRRGRAKGRAGLPEGLAP